MLGAWATPLPPRRPFLVWIGHLLIVTLAAVAPYAALAVFLLLGALARTWERSHNAVAGKRLRGSTGSGPAWAAGFASPFRFLLGLLEIALQALFPLILGVLVGIALDAAWTLLQGAAPPDGAAYATAMAVTLLITWVGIGSRTTRNGAHRILDSAAPDRVWTAVVLVLLILLLGAVVFTGSPARAWSTTSPSPTVPRWRTSPSGAAEAACAPRLKRPVARSIAPVGGSRRREVAHPSRSRPGIDG